MYRISELGNFIGILFCHIFFIFTPPGLVNPDLPSVVFLGLELDRVSGAVLWVRTSECCLSSVSCRRPQGVLMSAKKARPQ